MQLRERPSPNHGARAAAIDMLVLHYTGMKSAAESLDRLCDPAAQVSAHYLVEEDGTVWRLVAEERRAWHAGVSFWRGRRDINSASIGVEIQNPGHEFGYRAFPAAQMDAVEELCRAILARHPIPARHVLGHSDIAPARKQDPGELFDWQRLARAGIGLWPDDAPPAASEAVAGLLGLIGYSPSDPMPAVLTAFQRHFRPARSDGMADEETRKRLAGMASLCATG